MDTARHADVAVLGLGPAGRATAHRLAAHGVGVVAIDPSPARRWTPTYAAWADELPDWLSLAVRRTEAPAPRAWAVRARVVGRAYVVLDTPGLQDALGLEAVSTLAGTVVQAGAHEVVLANGRRVTADVVLDARGTRPHPSRAQQTAVGMVVSRRQAEPIEGTWFMDWRRDNGTSPADAPSFLYAVPLDDDQVLLEETCLAGRPALGLDELRHRLRVRLATRGVTLTGDERIERVRFCVEADGVTAGGVAAGRITAGRVTAGGVAAGRRTPRRGPVRIGSRAGLMHPASGYSVALSLSLADVIARAVRSGTDVEYALWPAGARRTQRLRAVGLTTLLRLPPSGVEEFFAAFFALPGALQRAYLSERDHPLATTAAMASMAASLRPSLTRVAIGSALRRERREPAG